jgi:multiple sugar transport system substrate-binding protein
MGEGMSTKELIAAIFCIVILVSGCGGKKEEGIKLMYWGSYEEIDIMKKMVSAFEQTHPEIDVYPIHATNYMDKLQVMIGGGTPPDLFYLGDDNIVAYAKAGGLASFEEMRRSDTLFDEEDYFELPFNAFKYDDELYGLPISWTPLVLYYNKDIFDKAGMPYPDSTWDWGDFLSACRKCTKDTDGDGVIDQFGYLLSTGWTFTFNWIWQNGGNILSPDGKRCVIDSKEAVDALQFLADLRWKYSVSPTPEQIAQRDLFTTGKIAMIVSGRWVVPRYRTIKDFRWGISHLPKGKVRATPIFTTAYVMSNKSVRQRDVWELAKFLSGKEGSGFIAELGLGVPSVKSVAHSPHFLNREKLPENSEIYLDALSYARLGTRTIYWQEIGNIMDTHLDELWFGKKDAKGVVDAIVEEVNRVLAEE